MKIIKNKKFHRELVKSNIADYELILNKASRMNKGRHCHDINRDSYRLQELIRINKKKAMIKVTMEDLREMGKLATNISYLLFLASGGR